MTVRQSVTVAAGPSIALTKYWGKQPHGINLPATPSLGITLEPFQSQATVSLSQTGHEVWVNGQRQPDERFTQFWDAVDQLLNQDLHFKVEGHNNFPTGAGLASSASGLAALAFGVSQWGDCTREEVSKLARIGSGSASRAAWGGFVEFPAGAEAAVPLYDERYWPELRLIVCVVDHGPKALSSRQAMEHCRATSPYYGDWLTTSQELHRDALAALAEKDIEKLGHVTRQSYLRMFGTMLSAAPPILYWQPLSVNLLHWVENLREEGIGVWETMDAGPQVKLLCLNAEVPTILSRLKEAYSELTTHVTQVGSGPCLLNPIGS